MIDPKTQQTEQTEQTSYDNEAVDLAYTQAFEGGFVGTQGEFFELLCTDEEALNWAYEDARDEGYNGNIDQFKSLLGVTQAQEFVDEEVKKKVPRNELGFGPLSEEESQSVIPEIESEFSGDDSSFSVTRAQKFNEHYQNEQTKLALKKFKEVNPQLDIPSKEEFYGSKTIPEILETSEYRMSEVNESQTAAVRKRQKEQAELYQQGKAELTPQQSMVNTLGNSLGTLVNTSDHARRLYGVVFGDMEQLGLAEAEIQRVEAAQKPVAEFTTAEEPMEYLAAFTDGVAGYLTSYAQARLTFGLGMASDMISRSIRSYNKEKALANNMTEGELYESGQADILLPATIGLFEYKLEQFGIKGVGKYLGKLKDKGYSMIGSLLGFGATTTREGFTEWGQSVGEQVNRYLGSTDIEDQPRKFGENLGKVFTEALTSRESREGFYKGMAGGFGATSLGASYNRLMSVSKTNEQFAAQEEALEDIVELNKAADRKISEEEKSTIVEARNEATEKIKTIQKEAEDQLNKYDEGERSELEQLAEEQRSLQNQMTTLSESTNLNEQQKKLVAKRLQEKFKTNVARVLEIKNQANKRAEETTTEKAKTTAEEKRVEEIKYTLPSDPKEARNDFEIIDNRDGSTLDLEEDGSNKWIVVNKKTNQLVETSNKRDAEFLAKNPKDNWDYGEGMVIEREEATQPTAEVQQNKEVDKSQFPLFEDSKGRKWRKVKTVKEGEDPVSFYVEDDKPLFRDENGIERPSATEKNELTGMSMSDSMLTPVKESYDISDENQTKSVEQKYSPDTEGDKFNVIDKAKKAQKALGKLFGDLNIVLHESDESFVKESGAKQTGRGAFNRKQNTIHINLKEADGTTVAHEAFHALFRNTIDSGKWSGATKAMFKAIAPELNPQLRKTIEDFVSDYDANVQNEEKLAELFGLLADSNTQFTPTTRQILKKWVNKVSKAIGLNRVISDADIEALEVKELFNVLSRKVETGEEITQREASMLDPEVREKLRKGEDLEQGTYVGEAEIKEDIEERDEDIPLQLKERTFDVTEVQRGSIKELAGKRVFAMAADRAAVGKVEINGREYNMMGGPLYGYLKQGGWAFTALSAASRVLNRAKETDGIALIMIQGTEGILGNLTTYDIVVDQFRLAVENGTVKESDLVDFINEKLFAVNSKKDKKTGKRVPVDSVSKVFMDGKGRGPVKNLDEFDKALRDATYEVRNPFMRSLIGGTKAVTPEIKKRFGINFSTKQLIEATTDPAFLNLETGDLVAAIQIDKDSEVIDTRESNEYETHPSYPFILKGKPLMVFNKPVDVRQVFGDYVSQTSGKLLGEQETKSQGAYFAMKAQPTTEVKEDVSPEETLVLMQKSTPKKITQKQVDDALSKDKTSQRILAKNIQVKTGDKVGVRLNLNVFKNTGVPVQAIHQGTKGDSYKKVNGVSGFWTGQVQNYAAAVTVKDAHFNTHQKSVYEVKNKIKNKFPLASVDGIYQDIPLDQQDFSGTEIRFNPMNTQLFEDMDGRPVRKAEEVTLLGTRVYARGKIEYFTEENKPKPYTPEDTTLQKKKSIDAVQEDSDNFMKALRKKRIGSLKPSKIATKIKELFLDRQASLKLILDDRIKNVLITRAGASAYAQQLFKDAEKTIYGGLSKDQERQLNAMIVAERIIAINKDRINRQVKAAKLIKEYGKTLTKKQAENVSESDLRNYYELLDGKYVIKDFKPYVIETSKGELVTAQSSVEYLENMKSVLSAEEYTDLEKRTKVYFDVYKEQLKELYDSGRITREAYEYFRDINYSPIKVLEKIIFDNASATRNGKDRIAKSYGISVQDIQTLSNRNEHAILMDSRWGLAMTMNAVQKKRFNNKLLGMIADAIEQDTKGQYAEEFTLDPKVAKKKGFVKMAYFKKGVPSYFYASPKMGEQIMDVRPDTKILDGLATVTGVNLLKALATQINPTFFYTNIPVDVTNAALFTKTYSRNKFMQLLRPAALAKLSIDVVKNIVKKSSSDIKGKGKYGDLYKEFLRYGGGLDYLSMSGLDRVSPFKNSAYDKFVDVASYTGTMSEQVVRIAVYQQAKNDMIAEYYKKNGLNPKGQDLEDILFAAAAEARETIDFAQGGSLIKRVDKLLPYTNAIWQGVRRPMEYALSNPGTFALSLAEVSVMAGFGGYYLNNLLLTLFLDDEEEIKEILRDLRDKTSKYEKANYYMIVNPRKPRDEKGNVNYGRIRKLPTISPLVTYAEEVVYANALGREVDNRVIEQSIRNSVPFLGGGFIDAMGQNPLVSAIAAYYGNYDTFRKEEIFKNYSGKEINNYAKGLDDPNIEEFYKILGRKTDISPKQLKVGTEKILTNPRTNVYVAMLYSGAETIAELKKGGADLEFFKEEGDKLMKNFQGRAYRQTSDYIGEVNKMDGTDFDQRVKDINTEEYLAKRSMATKIKELRESGQRRLDEEALGMIATNFERSSFKYYKEKYERMVKFPNVPRSDFEIVYERNPKAQAVRLKQYYGAGLTKREYVQLNKMFGATTGKKLNKNTFKYYMLED